MRGDAVDRLQQVTDVIPEVEPLDDAAQEPTGSLIEYRHVMRTPMPGTTAELVDSVTRLATEQLHDVH